MASLQVGNKVKINTVEGNYEGIVQNVNKKQNKITFEKLVCCETQSKCGVLTFHDDEVKECTIIDSSVVDPNQTNKWTQIINEEPRPFILRRNRTQNNLKNVDKEQIFYFNNFHLDVSQYYGYENEDGEIDFSKISNLKLQLPESHFVVSKVEDIDNALGCLEDADIVGLAIEGSYFKRDGILCWLQISTRTHIFLFDILNLKGKVFDLGLRKIIESKDVLKVVHDCRLMSDILHHQYNCKLENVFDTQVAAAFVTKQDADDTFAPNVPSLPHCLMTYLNLPADAVYIRRIREKFLQHDLSIWQRRPLPRSQFNAAIKEVIYLLELRAVLLDKMMEPFKRGVEIYLTTIKDCSNEERDIYKLSSHLLPPRFQSWVNNQQNSRSISNYVRLVESYQNNEDPYALSNSTIRHWKKKSSSNPNNLFSNGEDVFNGLKHLENSVNDHSAATTEYNSRARSRNISSADKSKSVSSDESGIDIGKEDCKKPLNVSLDLDDSASSDCLASMPLKYCVSDSEIPVTKMSWPTGKSKQKLEFRPAGKRF